MKKSKLITSLAAIGIAFMMFPQSVHAAGFVQDAAGIRYQNDDGSFMTNSWVQVGQNIYHLDINGIVQTGWIQVGNLWYLLDSNGVCTNPAGTATPPAETIPPAAPAPAAATAANNIFANAGWVPFRTTDATLLNNGIAAGLIGFDGAQYWAEPAFAATVQEQTEAASQPAVLQEQMQSAQITHVLNTNTKKFHKPTCRYVDDIKPSNREDSGLSRDAIIAMGYAACKKCGG